MRLQHFIPVSGGKDSGAVMCLAVERAERRGFGNMPPRFVHCDVGKNEHQATVDHIGYLDQWLRERVGTGIEIIRADFTAQLADNDPRIGIFIGGSTEWKLSAIMPWGRWAKDRGLYVHVGRVNSSKRIALCGQAGADSFDGTAVTRYASNLARLDGARRQRALL